MPSTDTSYSVIQPGSNGTFLTEWQNCLEQLVTIAGNNQNRIFKINIYVHSTDIEDFQAKKQIITDALLNTFGEICPTFGILAISPEKSFNIAIEIGVVNSSSHKIYYRKFKNWRYTIIENHGYKELWVNGIEDKTLSSSTNTASRKAFEIMRRILLAENMTFDNIVRQWNYIGKILHTGRHNTLAAQHYQIFNKARHDYYHRYRLITGYPAATGIGMNFNGIMIDFYAIELYDGLQIISVRNPNQVNSYNYDQKVQPPLFERAKLQVFNDRSRLFVSGTASIIGQDSVGKGDVLKQTAVTIENIEALINRDNLISQCPQLNSEYPDKYYHIRVYVKNASDIPLIKSICVNHFSNIPATYIQTDLCRDDLLVEIEAELHS
jgi:hypothetical protein